MSLPPAGRHLAPPILACTLLALPLANVAHAQNYAAWPGDFLGFGDGVCGDPATPCSIFNAIDDASDGGASGSTIFFRLSNTGGVSFFPGGLFGFSALDADVTFDTYVDDGGPTTGVPGTVVLANALELLQTVELTLAPNLELRLQGNDDAFLQLHDGTSVAGGGVLSIAGPYRIVLGDPAAPPAFVQTGVEDLRIDARGGSVVVSDASADDTRATPLNVTNLVVENGTFDLGSNDLFVGGAPTRFEVGPGATIRGTGRLRIELDFTQFPPTRAGAFPITGGGRILMDLEMFKTGGVRYELPELGGGGVNVNHGDVLFFTRPVKVHGTLVNEPEDFFDAARTEFDAPAEITGDLVFPHSGPEILPGDGVCGTGDESEIFFHAPVHIRGDLILQDTDSPDSAGCVEGVHFLAGGVAAGGPVRSWVDGRMSSRGASHVELAGAAQGPAHNLAVRGGLHFDAAPLLTLGSPSPGGESCAGNELVVAGGDDPQTLAFLGPMQVGSLRIQKDLPVQTAAIDPSSGTLRVDTALTLARGALDTAGRLDAASVPLAPGLPCAACPVFPRDDCRVPVESGSATLALKESNGGLKWKWARGEETRREAFGDPTLPDVDYSFCLWDEREGEPHLALAASLPGGAGWSGQETGFRYAGGAPDGIQKARLKAGADGFATIVVKGKGVALPALPLAQEPRVVAQLVSTTGECWGAAFRNSPRRNDAKKFKDRD